MKRLVWSFRLTGGEPFRGQLGPTGAFPSAVDHPGGRATTLWTARATVEEADAVQEALEARGIRVARWAPEESDEQREERARLRAAQADEVVFPTAKCPTCFWLDMGAEEPCGMATWAVPVVLEAMAAHERARDDAQACPVRASR